MCAHVCQRCAPLHVHVRAAVRDVADARSACQQRACALHRQPRTRVFCWQFCSTVLPLVVGPTACTQQRVRVWGGGQAAHQRMHAAHAPAANACLALYTMVD